MTIEIRTTALGLALILLAGCSEKPQTAATKKSDEKPWASARTAYAADGWKGGDQAAWEQQLRNRSQSQNEYSRTAVKP